MNLSSEGILFVGSVLLSVGIGAWMVRSGWAWGRDGEGERPPPVRQLTPGPEALLWLTAGVLVWLASMVGASAVAGLPASWVGADKSLQRTGMMAAGGYGLAITVGVLVLVLLRRWLPEDGRHAGMRWSWGDLPRGALALLMVFPFYVVVSQLSQMASRLLTDEAPSTIKHETLRVIADSPRDGWWWATIAGAAIGAPVMEELVYRVFIQGAALKATRGAWRGWAAVVLTSVVWAPIHLIGGAVPPSAVASLFVLGLGIGIAYERTRRLGVPIVMHVLFNIINLTIVIGGWIE